MTTKDPAQIDRFKEAARQLDCDEDEAAFDEKLKGIARQKANHASMPSAGTGRAKMPPLQKG